MDLIRHSVSYRSPYGLHLASVAVCTTLVSVTFTVLPTAWWMGVLLLTTACCVYDAMVAVRHGLAHRDFDGPSAGWAADRRKWGVGCREAADMCGVVRPVAWMLRRRTRLPIPEFLCFYIWCMPACGLLISGQTEAAKIAIGGMLGVYLVLAVCMVTSHRWQARKRAEVEQAGGMVWRSA